MAPIFPPELEQKIFEMAYSPDDHGTNGDLMLVARRMRIWLRPLVYRVFVQCTQASEPTKTFPNLNESVPPFINLDEICGFVKHLAIDSNCHNLKRASEIIKLCRNVENLACWGGLDLHDLWPILSQNTILRMLSGMVDGLTQEHLRSDTFLHVTHFEVLYPTSTWDFTPLSVLPSLTHLSIYRDLEYNPDDAYYQRLAGVLPKCQGLLVYIECISKAQAKRVSDDALQFYATDPRMVVFDYSMSDMDDWLRGARGGIDAWWHAENIAFARKQRYFLSEDYRENQISNNSLWFGYLTEEGKAWYSSVYSIS